MKHLTVLAIVVTMILASCSSITVTSDYDKSVDFTKFRTYSYYGWADNSDKLLNDFDKERIEKAFGAELGKRNLTYQREGGDITVALFIVTEQKQQTTATTTGMGGRYGYGGYYGYGPGWGWGTGMSTTTYNTYDYTVGTLVCDIFDTNGEQLIWEGVAQGTINENPQKREASIPKVVAQIMARYPVPAEK